MEFSKVDNWLLKRLSEPAERSLERKALTIIDMIAGEAGENRGNDKEMDTIYRLAHSALGKCNSPHEDWKEEIKRKYKIVRKDELKQLKKIKEGMNKK